MAVAPFTAWCLGGVCLEMLWRGAGLVFVPWARPCPGLGAGFGGLRLCRSFKNLFSGCCGEPGPAGGSSGGFSPVECWISGVEGSAPGAAASPKDRDGLGAPAVILRGVD